MDTSIPHKKKVVLKVPSLSNFPLMRHSIAETILVETRESDAVGVNINILALVNG